MKSPSRVVTTVAVGFLLLDAVLFAFAARYVAAGICVGAAALVLLAWRRYRRALAELAEARRDMKREAESLQALLQQHHLNQ